MTNAIQSTDVSAPLGFGPGGPQPAPAAWTNNGSWIYYGGGVVVGPSTTGGNLGPGSINANAFFINGEPFELGNYLPLAGGTIAGPLTVNGAFVVKSTVDGIHIDMGTF